MKKFFYLFIITALCSVLMISCKDDNVTDIVFNPKKTLFLLVPGETATITANLIPYGAAARLTWSSSNTAVATVESNSSGKVTISEGLITAKTFGTAIITVATKDGSCSETITVQVINPEPELILVEGGTFTMGCTDGEGYGDEFPVHQVTLSSYKIAKYPVTQDQWEAVMGTNSSFNKGHDIPIHNVNWHSVQEFINKLNAATGKNYRFPTEAEWEYAARGGNKSKGYKYSGSDDINAVAWYSLNSGSEIHPVGTKAPNELGIYDMSGNMWEWCSDWYGNYEGYSQENPQGSHTGNYRVIRGGAAVNGANACRISSRGSTTPNSYGWIGLRLVHP